MLLPMKEYSHERECKNVSHKLKKHKEDFPNGLHFSFLNVIQLSRLLLHFFLAIISACTLQIFVKGYHFPPLVIA